MVFTVEKIIAPYNLKSYYLSALKTLKLINNGNSTTV